MGSYFINGIEFEEEKETRWQKLKDNFWIFCAAAVLGAGIPLTIAYHMAKNLSVIAN